MSAYALGKKNRNFRNKNQGERLLLYMTFQLPTHMEMTCFLFSCMYSELVELNQNDICHCKMEN